MTSKPETKLVGELLELKKAGMLTANPEYQRGKVWDLTQGKKLIDSVLREYPLPLIYLHHIHKEVGGFQSNTQDPASIWPIGAGTGNLATLHRHSAATATERR